MSINSTLGPLASMSVFVTDVAMAQFMFAFAFVANGPPGQEHRVHVSWFVVAFSRSSVGCIFAMC